MSAKRSLCGDEARERGWIKEISMDSAKDSAREMLAAINVEGSGFWLLFYFSVSEYKYPWGYLLVTKLLVGYLIYRYAHKYIYDE
ncbi:hypothetical protein FD799_09745 [Klebsiella pneumoniae]|nr:hypothetical protein D0887_04330 [Klebsiella pneumoniae]AZB76486.1 hypothetical protein EG819_10265 [Klebsiella pneumoniae subsp. pneumoniae]EIW9233603.1 hypothetical protein [Klebsiella pneumoniae]KAA1542752.1 hypothetical protein F1D28_01895 [Klebsiella pneumoniae]KAA1599417.1 hypothetical protein F1D49_14270 [Klebsiella pneumoniae]